MNFAIEECACGAIAADAEELLADAATTGTTTAKCPDCGRYFQVIEVPE